MAEKRREAKSRFVRLCRWVWDQIIGDVPNEIALCEFDCRKEQCAMGEWETCDRRLQQAAGELKPLGNDPAKNVNG